MADVRCPMCGKPNPSAAEVCRYCQARLKPLVISPFTGDGAPIEPGQIPSSKDNSDAEASLPDWLRELRQQPEETPPPSEEPLPDWLRDDVDLAGRIGAEAPAEEKQEIESGSEPDWLQRIHARQQSESEKEEEAEPQETVSPAAELQDWLSGLDQARPAGEAPPSYQPAEIAPEPAPSTPEPPAQDLPDWFTSFQAASSQEKAPEQPAPIDKDLPDWLSKFGVGEGPAAAAGEEKAETASKEKEDVNVPDWLTKIGGQTEEKPLASEAPAVFIPKETPGPFLPEEEKAPVETPDLSALPDWIAQVSSEESPAEGASQPEREIPGSLAPAELPSWLEAMRPVESAAPSVAGKEEDESAVVERVGPLAGLSGTLPAEPLYTKTPRTAAYTHKLQVSDKQQALIELMQEMLASEGRAKPVPRRASLSTHIALRLAVALVLFLAVLVPLALDTRMLDLPSEANKSADITDTSYFVGTLPPGSPVLVAIDYEPGISAEMSAASSAVIDHLASRDPYVVLVSTNPTGPLLAEQLMANIRADNPDVLFDNLGYIPGGAAGLLAFAESPRQVLPYNMLSQEVWGSGPLASIYRVSDFKMVIVFTEKPDTARAWIEQVAPSLQNQKTPLLVVSSAQSEPMIRPYYETNPKLISGMVAGLAGGATYEALTGHPAQARNDWDAFGAGLMAAIAFILVGGIINAGLVILAPKKRTGGEGNP